MSTADWTDSSQLETPLPSWLYAALALYLPGVIGGYWYLIERAADL